MTVIRRQGGHVWYPNGGHYWGNSLSTFHTVVIQRASSYSLNECLLLFLFHIRQWEVTNLYGITQMGNVKLKLLLGQGWHSRSWLRPGLASLFRSTRWFSAKHQLQDWTDGPWRGGGHPKSFAYPVTLNEKGKVGIWQPWSDFTPDPLVEVWDLGSVSHPNSSEWEVC